jgi:uncharacterized membrane protein YdjX (TVP38/TMEM64 family)
VPSLRVVALAVLGLPALAAAAILLPHTPSGLREVLPGGWPLAPLVVIAAWVVLIPALFPGPVLAAAGGLAFGGAWGAALAFAGAVAGGLAAFVLARTGARGWFERHVARKPRLARACSTIERSGFAAVLAARLMPGVPAGALHYAAGLAPVRVRSFAAAIAIGALLRTVPYALLGMGLGSGSSTAILVAIVPIALGGLGAGLLARHLRRRAPQPA